jgi:hypothetical protein
MVGVPEVSEYVDQLRTRYKSGHAREHAYRSALEALMEAFPDVQAINDPKRSEQGAPDFIFLRKTNRDLVLGYAETKDINTPLDVVEKSAQMKRYAGYQKLFLTDYLEFRFYRDGEPTGAVRIGNIENGLFTADPDQYERLADEIKAFLDQPPVAITNGKKLAETMGAKCRRIRDDIIDHFEVAPPSNDELLQIYLLMRTMLIHDLDYPKFADMYAQTLVYGLFVARYNDPTSETFSREEARTLVPASNPFLQRFFDQILGPNLNDNLKRAVDELCAIFQVSDVKNLVHAHLDSKGIAPERDPIIYFYEDFLQAYDPQLREAMGAYYTPLPVAKYIVRNVDRLLKNKFSIAKGVADTAKITVEHDSGQVHKRKDYTTGKRVSSTKQALEYHRVQILDPAVGTATFLNEIINLIFSSFAGQEGGWPSYVTQHLIPRLHGFEIMMAPYTIAHLKLGMTLAETGATNLQSRLGVYLTNTLEEGIPTKPTLFDIGLEGAVTEESIQAGRIKSDVPIMVVVGNPPYSGVSNNETEYANSLVAKYKVEPGGHGKLIERKHWLNNDYVKFLAFAQDLVVKLGLGIVAMITDNSYLGGASFRGMRWRLRKDFDELYIVDLHGSSIRRDRAKDGSKDENVFPITQGVSIIFAIKLGTAQKNVLAEVYLASLLGTRKQKFEILESDSVEWTKLDLGSAGAAFRLSEPGDTSSDYESFLPIDDFFLIGSSGIQTSRDQFVVDTDSGTLAAKLSVFFDRDVADDSVRQDLLRQGSKKYPRGDTRGWKVDKVRESMFGTDPAVIIQPYSYRPLDNRYLAYDERLIDWPRTDVMQNLTKDNLSMTVGRQGQAVGNEPWNLVFVQDKISDLNLFYRGGGVVYPLFIYHAAEGKVSNMQTSTIQKFATNLSETPQPSQVFDYIYAVLHSPSYRLKYRAYLMDEFPRIPLPASDDEFALLCDIGAELRRAHLFQSPDSEDLITKFPVAGSNVVENVKYAGDHVWLNREQYVAGVPEDAWQLYIGGYQPAQKWLKDRRGRQLTYDEITTYQRIVKALARTVALMTELDNLAPAWADDDAAVAS